MGEHAQSGDRCESETPFSPNRLPSPHNRDSEAATRVAAATVFVVRPQTQQERSISMLSIRLAYTPLRQPLPWLEQAVVAAAPTLVAGQRRVADQGLEMAGVSAEGG